MRRRSFEVTFRVVASPILGSAVSTFAARLVNRIALVTTGDVRVLEFEALGTSIGTVSHIAYRSEPPSERFRFRVRASIQMTGDVFDVTRALHKAFEGQPPEPAQHMRGEVERVMERTAAAPADGGMIPPGAETVMVARWLRSATTSVVVPVLSERLPPPVSAVVTLPELGYVARAVCDALADALESKSMETQKDAVGSAGRRSEGEAMRATKERG